jgi:hypothetical protein
MLKARFEERLTLRGTSDKAGVLSVWSRLFFSSLVPAAIFKVSLRLKVGLNALEFAIVMPPS